MTWCSTRCTGEQLRKIEFAGGDSVSVPGY